ncbi:hypothetical protein BSZ35_16290 [Salinibacter sp. 10B]|uniref:Spy/CpxP family protein refolding chaperone n=1 Tax=Salinibacter sp. 10B TaxID=1923971 RepID=UPI000CF3831C|nr:Spy/CpxP family protein refolding chaperone [Salinibacter sp. 10B]PQJ36550.1 hypothetical protein BSZ35_16290 [Salinibacter sp. 10B]
MKRLTIALSILLTLGLLTPISASAQHPQHHGQRGMMARSDSMPGGMMGMMQGGMMGQGMMQMMRGMHQQMMQNPMHRSHMTAFMLPALADTLGLSDQQVDQINQFKSEAMSQHSEHQAQMKAQREEFMSLFETEGQPSAEAVRQHLTAMAEMRADQQAAMYEASQQMRQVLTDEQRTMLDSLPPQQKMRQMMSRMPMKDMMQMMGSMGGGMGECPMGGGMMSGMQGMPMMQGMHQQMMQQGGMQNMPMQQNRQNQ